jgi:hypothetical protein
MTFEHILIMSDEINNEQLDAAQNNLGDAKVSESKESNAEEKKSTMDKIAQAVKKAADAVDDAVDAAKDAVTNVAAVVDDKIDDARDAAPGVISEAKEKGQSLMDKVAAAAKVAADAVSQTAEKAADAAKIAGAKVDETLDKAEDKGLDLVDKVKDTVKSVSESETVDKVKDAVKSATESETADKVKEAIRNVSEKVADVADNVADKVKDTVKSVSESETVDKVKDAVVDASQKVADFAKDTVKKAGDAIKTTEGMVEEKTEPIVDYNNKSLKELVDIFQNLIDSGDQHELYKHAEMIKAAFYKVLKREKIASGFVAPVETASKLTEEPLAEAEKHEGEAAQSEEPKAEEPKAEVLNAEEPKAEESKAEEPKAEEPKADAEKPADEEQVSNNPFAEVERGFKTLYQQYKTMRASYLEESAQHKEENLAQKEAVIEKLKTLVEKQEDINRTFPEFRELQAEWRSIGPVPPAKADSVYENYQLYVEKFYDYVKINRELRDLDFKKNLESKTKLCEDAEALAEETNVGEAFRKLQKLHEQWKEIGPVDKDNREKIWDRFKAATAIINKKHQSYYDGLKDQQKDNLDKKTALCEKVEQIATGEMKDASQWNTMSKAIEDVQAEWKTIGFASKKENQKIYDRFRAACDKFFNGKRDFYGQFKNEMDDNLAKKEEICAKAEALKDSSDWKKTTEDLIELQKQWKEIGPVARKHSEQIWKRFRAACDSFFENRDKHFGSQDKEYADNLAAKKEIIKKVQDYVLGDDVNADAENLKALQQEWDNIGFVPFKEKDKVQKDFKDAMDVKFNAIRAAGGDDSQVRKYNSRYSGSRDRFSQRGGVSSPVRTERDRLYQKYLKEQQEIQTYENNIGFFSKSKNADALLADLNQKIAEAKAELAKTEQMIKDIDAADSAKNSAQSQDQN